MHVYMVVKLLLLTMPNNIVQNNSVVDIRRACMTNTVVSNHVNTVVSNHFHSVTILLFSSARSRDFDGTPCTELPVSMYTTKTPIDMCRFNVRSST